MDADNPRSRDNTSDMVTVPRKNKPTMVDVAKEARVSVATVSRVVNGKGGQQGTRKARVRQ